MITVYGVLSVVFLFVSFVFAIVSMYLFFYLNVKEVIAELKESTKQSTISGLFSHSIFQNTRIRKGTREYEEMSQLIGGYFTKGRNQGDNKPKTHKVLGGIDFIELGEEEFMPEREVNITKGLLPITEVLSSNTGLLVQEKFRVKDVINENYRLTKQERKVFQITKNIIYVSTNEKLTRKRGSLRKRN